MLHHEQRQAHENLPYSLGDTQEESPCNEHDIGQHSIPTLTLPSVETNRCEPNTKGNV